MKIYWSLCTAPVEQVALTTSFPPRKGQTAPESSRAAVASGATTPSPISGTEMGGLLGTLGTALRTKRSMCHGPPCAPPRQQDNLGAGRRRVLPTARDRGAREPLKSHRRERVSRE